MFRLAISLVLALALFSAVCLAKAEKPVSDDSLYDTVKRKLANDPVVKGGALEIDVKDGVVTLRGAVEQEKQKQKAERIVRKIHGVKSVVNDLKVVRR